MAGAEDLYQRFQAEGEDVVDEAISSHWTETRFLDFKQTQGKTGMDRDDRKTFAKALSAFANSEGGLIVWGVDCRRNADGVDAAEALQPISNLSRSLAISWTTPTRLEHPPCREWTT